MGYTKKRKNGDPKLQDIVLDTPECARKLSNKTVNEALLWLFAEKSWPFFFFCVRIYLTLIYTQKITKNIPYYTSLSIFERMVL